MSSITPGGLSPVNLAGAIAVSHRAEVAANQRVEHAAQRNFAIDQVRLTERVTEDTTELESSSDRDADGHLGYHAPAAEAVADDMPPSPVINEPRAIDAEGERGQTLDLEA